MTRHINHVFLRMFLCSFYQMAPDEWNKNLEKEQRKKSFLAWKYFRPPEKFVFCSIFPLSLSLPLTFTPLPPSPCAQHENIELKFPFNLSVICWEARGKLWVIFTHFATDGSSLCQFRCLEDLFVVFSFLLIFTSHHFHHTHTRNLDYFIKL